MGFEVPDIIKQIKDIKAIYDMNEKLSLISDTEDLEKDLFTGTATKHGVKRREGLYGINPLDTDTLEDRRFRVLVKENNKIPYTHRTLEKRLEKLCGLGGYRLEIIGGSVGIRVALTKKSMVQSVIELAENMVPLNMSLECDLLYNQHKTLRQFTYGQLTAYTHNQIRNEVLNDGD